MGKQIPFVNKYLTIVKCSYSGDYINENNPAYCLADDTIIGKRCLDEFEKSGIAPDNKQRNKRLKTKDAKRIYFM